MNSQNQKFFVLLQRAQQEKLYETWVTYLCCLVSLTSAHTQNIGRHTIHLHTLNAITRHTVMACIELVFSLPYMMNGPLFWIGECVCVGVCFEIGWSKSMQRYTQVDDDDNRTEKGRSSSSIINEKRVSVSYFMYLFVYTDYSLYRYVVMSCMEYHGLVHGTGRSWSLLSFSF